MEWYDDLPHIGYTVDGKKIMRPAKGDELDKFLATVEDPDSWYVPKSAAFAASSFCRQLDENALSLGPPPRTSFFKNKSSFPTKSSTSSGDSRMQRTRMQTLIHTSRPWSGSLARARRWSCR
jgi:hypothetical protein